MDKSKGKLDIYAEVFRIVTKIVVKSGEASELRVRQRLCSLVVHKLGQKLWYRVNIFFLVDFEKSVEPELKQVVFVRFLICQC